MVGVTDLESIGWTVPKAVRETFETYVAEKHGRTKRYFAFEVEEAMRYYINDDRGSSVEEVADALLDAAGLTLSPVGEKTPTGDVVQLGHKINPDLKDEFKKFVGELQAERGSNQARLTYGGALATAMKEYADGGRWASVEDKLGRVRDDAEDLLAELDAATSDGLTTREKRTVVIANALGDQFTHDDLAAEIERVAGETVVDDYVPRVLDRLDYVEHPNTRPKKDKRLYVPRSEAKEVAERETREREQAAEREARDAEARTVSAMSPDVTTDGQAPVATDGGTGEADAADRDGPPRPEDLSAAQRELVRDLDGDPDDPDDVADLLGDDSASGTDSDSGPTPAGAD